ncbi:MAG: transcriptional regulator [Desulfocapsaceae bacterium]|nr:transcriptional regulator [Desulfocapsaceae bacterium]
MATIRQQIQELLREGEWTALELSQELSVQEREIYDHLQHVRKSLRGEKLQVSPYHCRSCGYIFRKRERLDRPSRCPQCRESHIGVASFTIIAC